MIATCSDSMKRSLTSSQIGAPVHIDVPKSSRAIPTIQVMNCCQAGLSRPKRARSFCKASSETAPRSPAMRSSTTSPGMMRMRKKITIATPSSVGNMSANRFSRYFHMELYPSVGPQGGSTRGAASAPLISVDLRTPRVLLSKPNSIELIVQIVGGGNRPALHLRQVRDDPVPLERVHDVRFLVEHPLLELAQDLLALFDVP